MRRLILSLAGLVTLSAAAPAVAQFSESYKFLEAVRKKDGEKVTEALADPAQTVVNTRDVTSGETALHIVTCLLYTSPSPRDYAASRMPSSA